MLTYVYIYSIIIIVRGTHLTEYVGGRKMSRQKKKSKHNPLEMIILATAILNLLGSAIELLKLLL